MAALTAPVQSGLFQNPFLDPYSTPQGGISSITGQPLPRLQIPIIQTLIYRTEETRGTLSLVDVRETLAQAGITPREPVLIRDEAVGIELNLNLFGAGLHTPTAPVSTGLSAQTLGRQIPTTFREAHSVLNLITPQRSGSKNTAYGINELKQIARNLNIPSTGNKDVLANRIRTEIIQYFGLASQ